MPQYTRTKQAEADLIEIWLHIAADCPQNADMVLDALDDRSMLLAENPGLGAARDDILPGLRYFPWKNYLIFYHITEGGIEVWRYIHGARQYETLIRDP